MATAMLLGYVGFTEVVVGTCCWLLRSLRFGCEYGGVRRLCYFGRVRRVERA